MTSRSGDARLRAARLAAHGLDRRALPSVTAAVERLGAVQAQDLGATKWVLGARVPGSVESDVDDAIHARTVIRTWPMRGTLHLMPRDLVRPTLAVTGDRELHRFARRRAELGLDDAAVRSARRIAERDLAGTTSTRDELFAAWQAGGLSTDGQRGYHLLWTLAIAGVVCGGPVDGRTQGFALLDEWCPTGGADGSDRDETLARLFVAYAAGHGPIDERDFAWWTGLTLGDARRARSAAGDAVRDFDGRRVVAADASESARPAGRRALAAFDEYFLGYADRTAVCAAEHVDRVVPGRNGIFQPILLEAGRVVGRWRRSDARGGTTVTLEGFDAAIDPAGFRRSIADWARFRGIRLDGVEAS